MTAGALTMTFTAGDSLLLAGLLAAGLVLLSISQFVRVPYPIVLVLGGLGIAFIPGMPEIELPPDLVLVAILPPLLYGLAFFSSLRELRANVKPIGLLAVGLVLTTMVAIARRRARDARAELGGRLRARGDRLADRSDRRDRDRPAPGPAQASPRPHRRREPRQRRNRARRIQVRGGSRRDRRVLAQRGGRALRAQRRRRDRGRARGRLPGPPASKEARQPARRDHRLAADRLLRLPARLRARRLGRARRGHGRHLHGLAHPRADDRADAPPGTGGLGDGLPRPERAAVRAARACSCRRSSTRCPATRPQR